MQQVRAQIGKDPQTTRWLIGVKGSMVNLPGNSPIRAREFEVAAVREQVATPFKARPHPGSPKPLGPHWGRRTTKNAG